MIRSSAAVISTARSSRYALAVAETDTPLPSRVARHSRTSSGVILPIAAPPRYGSMCLVSSHLYSSTVRARRFGRCSIHFSAYSRSVIFPRWGIGPFARDELRFEQGERPVGRSLVLVGLGAGPQPAVRARIPDLEPAGRKAADTAETSVTVLVRHYAILLVVGGHFRGIHCGNAPGLDEVD